MLIAALLIATGRGQCEQDASDPAPGADAVQDDCRSVVMVRCAPPEATAGQAAQAGELRRAARKKLQARRLRQIQAQAGLNTIEVTGEPSTERTPDPWESFRQSLAGAAVASCFSQEAVPAAQGLLRVPVLLGAAAAGKCR